MGTEAFAEVASVLVPGLPRGGDRGRVRSCCPFKFYRHQPRTLHLSAVVTPGRGRSDRACRAAIGHDPRPGRICRRRRGCTSPPTCGFAPTRSEPRAIEFTPPAAESSPSAASKSTRLLPRPCLPGDRAGGCEGDRAVGLMAADLPPNASPGDAHLDHGAAADRAVLPDGGRVEDRYAAADGAATLDRVGSRPTGRPRPPQGRLYARVATLDGTSFDAQVIDEAGEIYVDLKGYRTVLPGACGYECHRAGFAIQPAVLK